MHDARSIIARKRDAKTLTDDEITWFANGLADGGVSDAQAGAFAMAVLLNGMAVDERVALTMAMRDTGQVLQWDVPGPVMDKHSTGGVGDTVSLVLAPALAACGGFVPMISGRGLGHTGGTLDKLEAIEGYATNVSPARLARVVGDVGCAIVGATGDIAPADRRLYGVRDVTATVESVDLITASILSKKLAENPDALVLDVKTGSGAFMKDTGAARSLARSLVDVANGAGCRTTALLTDMSAPLADCAGNALEVARALDCLTMADVDARLWDVSVALGGELLATSGLVADADAGRDAISEALSSGRAAEVFARMVTALGGPADLVERYRERLPVAPLIRDLPPARAGFVTRIDTHALGLAVVDLGGGRKRQSDTLDLSVGLDQLAGLGDRVDAGQPLARIHAQDEAGFLAAADRVRAAYGIADAPADVPDLVLVLDRIA